MGKDSLLFWVFFLICLYVSHHFYFFFVDPFLISIQLGVMYFVVFPVVFVPLSAILANVAKSFFLA
ncbi:hypothetical protein [Alkalibacillus haloalkaliphilus]|uniref:hypothetical protein n=1 Tax=Alkalibacillus haloalkaliphilus TaxID=94136 RepID=UPI0029367EB1|nr:hypothetical protein [Alkalibacillus haloalkaliphilus]MDV2580909.1 hypothetical protein [Alkalibacillus haloalkaliphilus]